MVNTTSSPWTPRSNTRGIAVPFLAALAVAYAVLWLGGAVEVLTHDEAPPGPECYGWLESNRTTYEEAGKWVGGGVLGRPGKVCVVDDKDEELLTATDVLSALLALVAGVGSGVLVWKQRQRGPGRDRD